MTSATSEQDDRTTDIALDATGLSKHYRRLFSRGAGNRALSDCGLELPTGKIAALSGRTGRVRPRC